ncbi:MAG: ChbG/HpnK family deacetylase, partial [Lachnospiraceae bacterium]|nr:ChbG/HpnK family deacetylase [Lachnospiraceae bacterium]
MKNKWVDIHADDFGVSVHASADIIEELADGAIDSISVIANMSCFPECVRLYQEKKTSFGKEPLISVHLNVLDAKAVSAK